MLVNPMLIIRQHAGSLLQTLKPLRMPVWPAHSWHMLLKGAHKGANLVRRESEKHSHAWAEAAAAWYM